MQHYASYSAYFRLKEKIIGHAQLNYWKRCIILLLSIRNIIVTITVFEKSSLLVCMVSHE